MKIELCTRLSKICNLGASMHMSTFEIFALGAQMNVGGVGGVVAHGFFFSRERTGRIYCS